VQHVDRLAEPGHVEDPMLDSRVQADLIYPRPDGGQGLQSLGINPDWTRLN